MERLKRIARAGLAASGYYSDEEDDVNGSPSSTVFPKIETEMPVVVKGTPSTRDGSHQGGADGSGTPTQGRETTHDETPGQTPGQTPDQTPDQDLKTPKVSNILITPPTMFENTARDHPLARYTHLSSPRDATPNSPAPSTCSTVAVSSAPPERPGAPPEPVEEGSHVYGPGGFHPVRLFEVYNSRYLVLRKLGWGRYSTVWLVRDMQHHSDPSSHHAYYAMKVLSAECYYAKHPVYEREILRYLRGADKSHPGYKHVCHLLDDFEHQGPMGIHVCLVFEVMGETMQSFTEGLHGGEVDNEIMKKIVVQLLLALKFAHDNGVVHTDIKQDNIFIRFQVSHSIIESVFLPETIPDIIPSDQPYRPIRSVQMRRVYQADNTKPPVIALGDFGIATWAHHHLTEDIQPVALRAPEVLLHAGWDHRADLWNLGAIVMEMFRNKRMFHPYIYPPKVNPNKSNTELAAYYNTYYNEGARMNRHGMVYFIPEHLHEMELLFGRFPETLLKRANPRLLQRWFNKHGQVRGFDGHRWNSVHSLGHEWWMGSLDLGHAAEFREWIYCVMRLDPEMRPTIDQLLRHRWLREAEE